jgi:propionyl-CoA carboxylase alpha chain
LPVGEGIRVDNGFEQGMDISIMIRCLPSWLRMAKPRRGNPIMIKAIDGYLVEGVETTLPFGNLFWTWSFSFWEFWHALCEKYYSADMLKKTNWHKKLKLRYDRFETIFWRSKIVRLPNQ